MMEYSGEYIYSKVPSTVSKFWLYVKKREKKPESADHHKDQEQTGSVVVDNSQRDFVRIPSPFA